MAPGSEVDTRQAPGPLRNKQDPGAQTVAAEQISYRGKDKTLLYLKVHQSV